MAARDVLVALTKLALLTYIFVGVTVLLVVRRRRIRAARDEFLRTDPAELRVRMPRPAQPGHEASIQGVPPRTPMPDWVYLDDNADG